MEKNKRLRSRSRSPEYRRSRSRNKGIPYSNDFSKSKVSENSHRRASGKREHETNRRKRSRSKTERHRSKEYSLKRSRDDYLNSNMKEKLRLKRLKRKEALEKSKIEAEKSISSKTSKTVNDAAFINVVKSVETAVRINKDLEEKDDYEKLMESYIQKASNDIEESSKKVKEVAEKVDDGFDVENDEIFKDEDRNLVETERRKLIIGNKRCFICKQYGHTKADCPNKRCLWCKQRYHMKVDCPLFQEHMKKKREEEKEKKRQRFYQKKKEMRKEDRLQKLREATGIYGFKRLYRILDLPEYRLATEHELKKAYQKKILIWHPDKHNMKSDEEKEYAREKFDKIKDAYELLVEGLKNGNIAGHAVASKGSLADLDSQLRRMAEQFQPQGK